MVDLFNNKQLVGFEQLLNFLDHGPQHQYPPHNLVKLAGGDSYVIEMAVAGFKREDIEVTLEENTKLIVTASKVSKERLPTGAEYIYHSLASRNFSRRWVLAENIRVESVQLEDGILSIKLTKYVPENRKARRLEIK